MFMASILIVDDSPVVTHAVSTELRAMGHAVSSAKSLSDIIAQLEDKDIDILILDLNMPTLSGEQLGGYLKHRLDGIKVIIYSGDTHERMSQAAMAIGASKYVEKTEDLFPLREAINSVLGIETSKMAANRPATPKRERLRNIILVDDDLAQVRMLEVLVGRMDDIRFFGFESPWSLMSVDTQSGGALVLMDVNLVGSTTGDEFARRFRATPLGKMSRIYLYSGIPGSELARLAKDCGADGFLEKGTPAAQLASQLTELLN